MKKTFRGGIHPKEGPGGKNATSANPTIALEPGKAVAILMSQHVGAPCQPTVKPGDRVFMGQRVGEPTGYVGAPVHASVSGTVKGIAPRVCANGQTAQAVIIENDGLDEWDPSIAERSDISKLSKDELLSIIREAGIVGLGGAAFPTQVKLSPPSGKIIDTVILNGAECEPYLTSDHRTMLERAADIVSGMRLALQILSAPTGYIGIEDNKPDAIAAMRSASAGAPIEVVPLGAKYPQGGEKQLIYSITRRQVPSGGLPMDAGVVVINVSTAAAIHDAVYRGRPIVERVVTVCGLVKNPANLRARIGTPVGELIEKCGGALEGADKLIFGGPMMGLSGFSLDTPTAKGTGGILLLSGNEKPEAQGNCIRCGTCVDNCPIGLMPQELYALSIHGKFSRAASINAMDCIECGTCSYGCPAKLPLVQSIRVAKREISRKK